MFKSVNVLSEHKDLIHDVAYDFHGRRIATCSSDQTVKIWDQNDNGQWVQTASWKTHWGSVWRVIWAHPEFGQVIATCSFDRTALIWEEVLSESDVQSTRRGGRGPTHWVKRCSLVDSRSNVTDIKFAPRHIGLQLATCSQSGVLRIYEAVDIMNLSQWNLQHEIPVSKHRCSAISWSTSRYHSPLIAVSCDDPVVASGKVFLFEYNEQGRKWWKVETIVSIADAAYDVSFAPNVGRSYHQLAVASKNLHVFQIKPLSTGSRTGSDVNVSSGSGAAANPSLNKYDIKELPPLDLQNSQVWRVSWNVTGTILASSGSDGTVKLWKANYLENWKNIVTLKPGESKLEQLIGTHDELAASGRYY